MDEQNGAVVIRRHPLIVLRNFLVLEIVSALFFYLIANFTSYEELYNQLPLKDIISIRFSELLVVTLLELFIVSYIFIRWFFETYEFVPSGIIHRKGLLIRNKEVHTFSPTFSVGVVQGPIGRLLRLGTLVFHDSLSRNAIRLTYVTNPSFYADFFRKHSKSQRVITDEAFSKIDLFKLLGSRENETLEFKTTFRWDTREGKVNKDMEHAVVKTIAAFLNSKGGHLVIGVDDSGKACGLLDDYKTLKKQNADGFELQFTTVFNGSIGAEFRDLVKVEFVTVGDKEVVVIHVLPSPKPVYVVTDKGEHFFVRTGNATTDLTMRQAASYIESHWKR